LLHLQSTLGTIYRENLTGVEAQDFGIIAKIDQFHRIANLGVFRN